MLMYGDRQDQNFLSPTILKFDFFKLETSRHNRMKFFFEIPFIRGWKNGPIFNNSLLYSHFIEMIAYSRGNEGIIMINHISADYY